MMPASDINVSKHAAILLKILNKITLFNGLNNGSKLSLISICKEHRFEEGEIIFCLNDESDRMYIVITGYIDVILANNQVVATIKPNSMFGEMGVFSGEKRSATVIARTRTVCFSIERKGLDSLLLKNAVLGRDLLRNVVTMLAAKINENNIMIEELTKELETKNRV